MQVYFITQAWPKKVMNTLVPENDHKLIKLLVVEVHTIISNGVEVPLARLELVEK